MTQEVQVNVTLFLEADADLSAIEIKKIVYENLHLLEEPIFFTDRNVDLIKFEINSIKEEAEIYGNE
jgi:hypothetical protein